MSFEVSKLEIQDSCLVCFEPFTGTQPPYVHNNLHPQHMECLLWWARTTPTCPMCRENITSVNNKPIGQWQQEWGQEAQIIDQLKAGLYEAAKSGNTNEVQRLMGQLGARFTGENRALAISFALKAKRQGVVELLVAGGEFIPFYRRHLYLIAAEHFPNIMERLSQIMPMSMADRDMALMAAIVEKRTKAIPALLGLGPISVETRGRLIIAAFEKNLIRDAHHLIEQGPFSEEHRLQAIQYAIHGGNRQTLKALLQKGPLSKESVKIAIQTAYEENKIDLIFSFIPDLELFRSILNDDDYPELYEYISYNERAKRYVDILEAMVEGREINDYDHEFANNEARHHGHTKVIAKLIEYREIDKKREQLSHMILADATLAAVENSIKELGVYFREEDRIVVLRTASSKRRMDIIRALLAKGPLNEAHEKDLYRVLVLLNPSSLAELNQISPLRDANREFFIIQSVKGNKPQALSELLKFKSIPERLRKDVAMIAIRAQSIESLKVLLQPETLTKETVDELILHAEEEGATNSLKVLKKFKASQQ